MLKYPAKILTSAFIIILMVTGCNSHPKPQKEYVSDLMRAAHAGDLEALEGLIDAGADIDELSSYGWTAVMFASWRGHPDCVEALISAGAELDKVSGWIPSGLKTVLGHPPTTALAEAVRNRHFDIATMLLDAGAAIDPEAVALAAREENRAFLERVHAAGFDFNTSSGTAFQATALCTVMEKRNTDLAKWLLDHGADPNFYAVGQTPINEAVQAQWLKGVQLLIERGSRIEAPPGTHIYSPLFNAASLSPTKSRYPELEAIIALLLESGADPLAKNYEWSYTALEMASAQAESTRKYLKRGSERPEAMISWRETLAHKEAVIKMLEAAEVQTSHVVKKK